MKLQAFAIILSMIITTFGLTDDRGRKLLDDTAFAQHNTVVDCQNYPCDNVEYHMFNEYQIVKYSAPITVEDKYKPESEREFTTDERGRKLFRDDGFSRDHLVVDCDHYPCDDIEAGIFLEYQLQKYRVSFITAP